MTTRVIFPRPPWWAYWRIQEIDVTWKQLSKLTLEDLHESRPDVDVTRWIPRRSVESETR